MDEINEIDGSEIQETTQENEAVIYTGPNILAMALQKFQIFKGGLPPYVTRAIEKIPEIKNLIVPVTELETMRQKISRPGTNESRLSDIVQKDAAKYNAEYRKSLTGRRRA